MGDKRGGRCGKENIDRRQISVDRKVASELNSREKIAKFINLK